MKTYTITVRKPNGMEYDTELTAEPQSFTRLASQIGVTRTAVSKWFNNREPIPEWRYEHLLRLDGVTGPFTTSTTPGEFTYVVTQS